jgi:23S rRNA (cytosine1962-C5)-methyltransferase
LIDPAPLVARTRAWTDYALVDSGAGRKLERYGPVHVVRPEPQCWWTPRLDASVWAEADAVFDPAGDEDEGRWRLTRPVAEAWTLTWAQVKFQARLTPFRHLAFFPEQGANWSFVADQVAARPGPFKLLNLFGYTGVASLAAAQAGAAVTHVDASKKAVGWARENAALSGLDDSPIRWIVEDARRWVQREMRRGSRYQGVILDPPKFGRGPAGEVWRLPEDLAELVRGCAALLSEDADFLLLNGYAARLSGLSLAHLVAEACQGRGGVVEWGELALEEEPGARGAPRALGLSFFARWRRSRP